MGSGNSKLTPEGETMPARIRPVIHRWFEEIKRRRNANMSKKGLLKDAVEGEESSGRPRSLHDRESESTSSLHKNTAPSKAALPVVEEKSDAAVVPRPSVSDKTNKESKEHKHDPEICGKRDVKGGRGEEDEEEKENRVVEKAVVVEEVVAVHKEDHHDQETTEEEEEEDDELDTYICPGSSPSFRVYCVHSTDDDEEEEEEEISKKGSRHKNSPSTGDSVESNFSEDQEITRTKKIKGNKGRRLKRAIRKSGPAVKNLLHVATCYHPACSGQDRAHLLEEKAQAA
ncbi:histone H3.v1 [Juglans microcarpa x Juglans regia]|uniref:histone H3.v1 n=1 Tax=Juglans microcarpa x Juglans regia TaxID=2249226 RepID=UPI001B7D9943|nr:histone H3.v1 [Juglans microcarpa x Juglans regia]